MSEDQSIPIVDVFRFLLVGGYKVNCSISFTELFVLSGIFHLFNGGECYDWMKADRPRGGMHHRG